MKKNQIFVFMALLLLPSVFLAQQNKIANEKTNKDNWPPNNSEWYYQVNPLWVSFPRYVSYQNTKVIGDTIILSKECRILQKCNVTLICDNMGSDTEFIYEENNKVYWYNRVLENFTLLYDFSAGNGDFWEIFVDSCSFIVNVDSVGLLSVNDQDCKIIHISDENHYFTGDIIENIGHTISMFPKDIYFTCKGVACDSDHIYGLRCYLQNDTLIYKRDETPCDTIYEVYYSIDEIESNCISFYPNPFTEVINIQLNNCLKNYTDELQFNLYNSMGSKIKYGLMPKSRSIKLSGLKSGFYYIHLLSNNEVIHKQKIIKQ